MESIDDESIVGDWRLRELRGPANDRRAQCLSESFVQYSVRLLTLSLALWLKCINIDLHVVDCSPISLPRPSAVSKELTYPRPIHTSASFPTIQHTFQPKIDAQPHSSTFECNRRHVHALDVLSEGCAPRKDMVR